MDANELADKLEKPMLDNPDCPNFSRTRDFMEQVVATLRQQQARINELEKLMSDMKYEKSSGVYELSEEKIANVWLFLEGKAEGVLESGGIFNFPLEFYKAIKELEK